MILHGSHFKKPQINNFLTHPENHLDKHSGQFTRCFDLESYAKLVTQFQSGRRKIKYFQIWQMLQNCIKLNIWN